jgi:hypothetical protein
LRNVELKPRTRHDIDQQVAKLLSGIGNPEPPLQLSDVRDALKLDLQFYSSTQTSVLSETVHRFRVGLHQVARRPFLLIDVVKKLSLKALWVADAARFHIRPAYQIATVLLMTNGPTDTEIEALTKRLEFGLPAGALGLLELPVQLTRGELLALFRQGVKSAAEVWRLSSDSLQRHLGKAKASQLMKLRPGDEV